MSVGAPKPSRDSQRIPRQIEKQIEQATAGSPTWTIFVNGNQAQPANSVTEIRVLKDLYSVMVRAFLGKGQSKM
jgi:hypothetical protein